MSSGGISVKAVGASGSGATLDHNNRKKIKKDRRGEIDYRRTNMKKVLYTRSNPRAWLRIRILQTESFNKRKMVRRGKNTRKVLMTFVAHASGDYFFDVDEKYWEKLDPGKSSDREIINKIYNERLNKEKLKDWEERVLKFAKEEFGDNLLQVVRHMDEKTPHIHIDMIPFKDGRINKNGLYPWKKFAAMIEGYNKKVNIPVHLKEKGLNAGRGSVDFRFYKVLKRAGIKMEYYNAAIRTLKNNPPETTYKVLRIKKEDVKPVTKKKDVIFRLLEYYKTDVVGLVKMMQGVIERYESQKKSPEVQINNGKER